MRTAAMEQFSERPFLAGSCQMTIKSLQLVVVKSVTSTVNFDGN